MARQSDAELAGQAARGDDDAFAELVRRYQNAIYEMSSRMLKDREAGYDAAQEVFLKAHSALDRYDPSRKFSTWILAITRNHCIDQIRRPARKRTSNIEEEARIPDEKSASPSQNVEHKETSQLIEQAVSELSDTYREAVELYHFQDLTYAEAAEVQGVPLGTFMARLHRARKKLREKLGPSLGEDDAGAPERSAHRRAG